MSDFKGTVHVVDDDSSWRTSLQRLLSAAGYSVAVYESADKFLATADTGGLGCVLLDLRMPGLNGLELQQRLAARADAYPVVFVTGHGDIPTTVHAMKTGAQDFLTKPVETDVLIRTVEQAISRHESRRSLAAHLERIRTRVGTLTPAERKVFDAVVRGRLNKQIADDLGTAERTVKWHRHNLMIKMGVDSVAELVSAAVRLGLIEPSDTPPR